MKKVQRLTLYSHINLKFKKMKKHLVLFIATIFLISCASNETKTSNVIGSANLDGQSPQEIYTGDVSNQQIWTDYIKAHNERDLEKIAEINAEDWIGYTPDGSVVRGSDNHIEILDNWFKTANPKWEIRWMIANSAEDNEGQMTQWLTTGNDYFDVDESGNEIFEHNVHDIKFVNGKIKEIYVYSREKAQDSLGFSY